MNKNSELSLNLEKNETNLPVISNFDPFSKLELAGCVIFLCVPPGNVPLVRIAAKQVAKSVSAQIVVLSGFEVDFQWPFATMKLLHIIELKLNFSVKKLIENLYLAFKESLLQEELCQKLYISRNSKD